MRNALRKVDKHGFRSSSEEEEGDNENGSDEGEFEKDDGAEEGEEEMSEGEEGEEEMSESELSQTGRGKPAMGRSKLI